MRWLMGWFIRWLIDEVDEVVDEVDEVVDEVDEVVDEVIDGVVHEVFD